MSIKHIQCHCGQVVSVPAGAVAGGMRCPACGAMVRTEPAERADRGTGARMPSRPKGDSMPFDMTDGDEGGEYGIVSEPEQKEAAKSKHGEPLEGTWVPSAGHMPPSAGSRRKSAPAAGMLRDQVRQLEQASQEFDLPGRFFTWAALVYPFIHPNWIHFLGLAVVSLLAVGVVAGTLFVFSVIMRFGAYVSLFGVPAMALGCLALISYVIASFVVVIEETARGEERLTHLAELNWWETLPKFMCTVGAASVAAAVTFGLTYPMRRWFPWNAPEVLVIQGVLFFQLFPVLLITNLVDGTWVPQASLIAMLSRLASCAGYFALFLILTALPTVGAWAVLKVLSEIHFAAGLAAAGPVIAAWLMLYGHWLGRLSRQLTAVE